jgi:putative Mg2+ transporter-C (MgtC) family protein
VIRSDVANMLVALVLGWRWATSATSRARCRQPGLLPGVRHVVRGDALAGYPEHWYWGREMEHIAADLTKVMPAILTGIGFLGAGLIVRSGSTSAASPPRRRSGAQRRSASWSGPGVVAAAGLTALFVACTAFIPWLEHHCRRAGRWS